MMQRNSSTSTTSSAHSHRGGLGSGGGGRGRGGGPSSFSGSKRKREGDEGTSSSSSYHHRAQHSEMRQDSSRLSYEYLERNGQPRPYTVSVAIPSSIIAASQTREFKTLLIGQLARTFALHKVDEVIVYSDETLDLSAESDFNPCLFIARLLQYAETPSYLRKGLFSVHPNLRFAGLLMPLDCPHHMRREDNSLFREGIVTERPHVEGSLVNVGLRNEALIDRTLKPGLRVTVQMLDAGGGTGAWAGASRPHQRPGFGSSSSSSAPVVHPRGVPVAPNAPRERYGLYWGYQTRAAKSLGEVFAQCPYFASDGGYDLLIGHSEDNGSSALVDAEGDPSDPSFVPFALPPFRHMLVVFGGSDGLEANVDADERLSIAGRDADTLFDLYLKLLSDTGPMRGCRTLRTEEAVQLGLTKLSAYVARNVAPSPPPPSKKST